jgi:two-component system sensor histidine kinase DesK
VVLEVADNGRGFSRQAGPEPEKMTVAGSGLRGMSERLAAVGGRLSLGPGASGRGFRLAATVPAAPAPRSDDVARDDATSWGEANTADGWEAAPSATVTVRPR